MGPINLSMNQSCLWDAWDEQLLTEVEGFKSESNAKCFNETLIKHPPNVLLFLINRVQFDKKANNLVKNKNKFTFEKTMFIDAFLLENR